jgi:Putative adhesin
VPRTSAIQGFSPKVGSAVGESLYEIGSVVSGGEMKRFCSLTALAVFSIALLTLAGCNVGPAASGRFERSLPVSGPIRLELANASGDVTVTGSADGKVHVLGEVHSSGMGFANPQKRLDEVLSNPPVEQKGDTIRIGKELSSLHNVSITYTIEVPRDTEVSTTLASGAQTMSNIRGPVKANAASGSIRVEHISRGAQLTTLSGSINADDIGEDLRASSASGSVTASNIKGDVEVNALSGATQISKPSGRVEADTASGSVKITGATSDVKARAASGSVNVQGNPGANNYWNLRTVSGTVQISVSAEANFQLAADAVSGEIKTEIPIVIEEQDKHSLRAHTGTGGGRIEIHTTSGEIRIGAS